MAIKMRRGQLKDFNPSKMQSGEWAVSTDADTNDQRVYMAFAPGVIKEMMTTTAGERIVAEAKGYRDETEQIKNATNTIKSDTQAIKDSALTEIATAKTNAVNTITTLETNVVKEVTDLKDEAAGYKDNSADSAKLSESYAHGSTGTRTGEDTDNSMFYSQVAKNLNDDSQKVLSDARDVLAEAQKKITGVNFTVDMNTGMLLYNDDSDYVFHIDETTGELMWDYAS